MDWDWNNPTKIACRPKYVRHIDWFPCDCPDDDSKQLRCFFGKHGFTHGVAHKKKNQKRNTPSTARGQCSTERVRLKSCDYCYMCVNEIVARTGNNRTWAKKNGAKQTRLGCSTCSGSKAYVCEEHWPLHGN